AIRQFEGHSLMDTPRENSQDNFQLGDCLASADSLSSSVDASSTITSSASAAAGFSASTILTWPPTLKPDASRQARVICTTLALMPWGCAQRRASRFGGSGGALPSSAPAPAPAAELGGAASFSTRHTRLSRLLEVRARKASLVT